MKATRKSRMFAVGVAAALALSPAACSSARTAQYSPHSRASGKLHLSYGCLWVGSHGSAVELDLANTGFKLVGNRIIKTSTKKVVATVGHNTVVHGSMDPNSSPSAACTTDAAFKTQTITSISGYTG